MPQLMTLDEKPETLSKARELEKAGDKEESIRLRRSVPIPPCIAKIMKEKTGMDFLIKGGWSLAEAEAEFGQGWITN
ncbi:MAG: hypothetical protein LBR47_05335 [Spirochaetaceae bacterium]|nr:hypothetical protein [Spirochaetaceae bacterium]